MKKFMSFFVAISICILLTGTLFAQETGEIAGKVVDDEGAALPGVSVNALSPSLQGTRSAVSRNDGSFKLPLLPIGNYTLTLELQGFAKLVQENVEVKLGMVTTINVNMKIATIEEQITVVAQAALIDKTKADTSTHFRDVELKNAPVQSRSIQELIHFTPGVTNVRVNTTYGVGGGGTNFGQASIRGQGDSENNWLVDGLSKRGSENHEPGVRVNYDSWEEVQVLSDPYSPELGQTYGGIINIVTKTGGNEFHGELGASILPNSLRASRGPQLSVSVEPETGTYNYFGNIGGPIVKDKLWFFLSNNYWSTRDATQAGSFGWLEIPAGKRTVNTNNFFGKLTFTPLQNHTISFSGTYDKFISQSGGVGHPSRYTARNYTDYAYRLNYKAILGPNTLIEAIVGRSSADSSLEPQSGETGHPAFKYNDINQWLNNIYSVQSTLDQRTDFVARFTQYLNTEKYGNHEIGLGFLYYDFYIQKLNDVCGEDWDPWPGNTFDAGVWYTFSSPGIPIKLDERFLEDSDNTSKGFGLYFKDKMTLGRFSVMAGLRLDTQKIWNDVGELSVNWDMMDFFSPRFSLAWDITGDGANVFKVGAAQFTDVTLFTWVSWLNLEGGSRARIYEWIGPLPYTDEAQLRDPANWNFTFQMGLTGEPGIYVSSETGGKGIGQFGRAVPDKETRITVEFDRRLGPDWALKLRGVYNNRHDMLEDNNYFDYESRYWLLENWPLKKRDYKGIEVELNGRISDRFFLNSSYIWSQAKGATPGNRERQGDYSTRQWNIAGMLGGHWSGPDDSPLAWLKNWNVGQGGPDWGLEGWYGFLPHSVDHVFKIMGTYLAPHGFNITANFEWCSGYHYSIKGLQPQFKTYTLFPYGRGTETAPAHSFLDLSVQKDFVLTGRATLGLRLNVTNILNTQTPISYMSGEGSSLFGEVYGRQFPRWIQIQALFRF